MSCQCCPKTQKQHWCNLGMKQIHCWIHESFELICQFAKQIWTTNNVSILMQTILHPVNISFIIANILFLSHCCAKFGRFNKVPNFGSCNVDGVFANLWSVYNVHSIDLARNCASMLICSPGLGLLKICFVSCLAQLSLQRCCMPQQDMPFGDKSPTFVTRHYVIVFPVSWSTSFGSAIGHWLSKVDTMRNSAKEKPPCCCICA